MSRADLADRARALLARHPRRRGRGRRRAGRPQRHRRGRQRAGDAPSGNATSRRLPAVCADGLVGREHLDRLAAARPEGLAEEVEEHWRQAGELVAVGAAAVGRGHGRPRRVRRDPASSGGTTDPSAPPLEVAARVAGRGPARWAQVTGLTVHARSRSAGPDRPRDPARHQRRRRPPLGAALVLEGASRPDYSSTGTVLAPPDAPLLTDPEVEFLAWWAAPMTPRGATRGRPDAAAALAPGALHDALTPLVDRLAGPG